MCDVLIEQVLAKSILAKRNSGEEDGVYWAVVEFIDRVRTGELNKIFCSN
jgi:hypothetical protein